VVSNRWNRRSVHVGSAVIVPMADDDVVTVHRNLPFRDTPTRTLDLDLYRAPGGASGDARSSRPAVVLVHGGAWHEGTKGQFARYALDLASEGYVAVEPTYRLSGEATFPAPVTDVVSAVRWVRANATTYGVDPDRIALLGHSAGAHLATLAALVPDWWSDSGAASAPGVGCASAAVGAVVGVSGVYEFRDAGDPPEFVALLGGTEAERPERYREASPVEHARPDAPPALLVHGEADEVVPPASTRALVAALREAGAPVEHWPVPDADHVFLHSSAHYRDVFARVCEFLSNSL
jgi:acetyl esterase/lipase